MDLIFDRLIPLFRREYANKACSAKTTRAPLAGN